jgi:hypothetical protein
MTDDEIQAGAGGTLIVDTEAYPNYFLIAFKDVVTKKIIKFEVTSLGNGLFSGFNERMLSWILHNYTTVGFNSIKYDLPMIWASYKYNHPELLKEVSNSLILGGMWHKELTEKYDFTIYPTKHVDLIEVCPLRGSLKLYGGRLHAQRIQDLPFKDYEPLTEDQIEIVSDYCINDLDSTELLMDNLLEQLKLRLELTNQYHQDLMSKSDAQIAEAVIGSELKRLTGKWPSKPKIDGNIKHKYIVPPFMSFQTKELQTALNTIATAEYELSTEGRLEIPVNVKGLSVKINKGIYRIGIGGLHSSESEVCYKSNDEYELIDRDVASYYPAIILNLKLYPQSLGPDFLTVYQTLVNRRLEAKKAKNVAVAECLKITINGTFGKTGSPYSILYAPDVIIQILLGGQLCLLMLIEQLELNGIEVVSANTDGIVMYCHKDKKETLKMIFDNWEKATGFVTEETSYSAVYSRDVNAYMAIKPNGEVKGKNIYYDPWRGKSAKDGYWRFQKNPNAQICIEAIENLLIKQIPVATTIQECKDITKFVCVKNVKGGAHKDGEYLGKVVRWYMAKGIVGTINYILSGNKVPDTDGALPCMDLPEVFPDNIDYDWYVKKAVEMLYDMAYYQRPKQISFF